MSVIFIRHIFRAKLSLNIRLIMKTHFTEEWKNWIKTNVDAGQNKDGLFKILIDEGYDYTTIKNEMGYEPKLPVAFLINPFNATKQRDALLQQTLSSNTNGTALDPSQLFLPNAERFDSEQIELYTLKDFLNKEECEKIIALINKKKQPSALSSHEADQAFRTSSTCHLGKMDDDFMSEIDQRICKLIGIHSSYSETIQGQYYEVGQEFKPHTDYFENNEISTHANEMGQRTYTFMIYLNNVEAGGETVFPKIAKTFEPTLGTAVIWNSLHADGSTNAETLHHAMPIKKGYKAIITKWFRSRSYLTPSPSMQTKEANEYITNYTKTGIHKQYLDDHLFQEIVEFYNTNKTQMVDEHVPGDFIYNKGEDKKSSSLVELSPELKEKIHDTMKPLLEQWCGETLEPTYVYGIRIYHDNAVLKEHRDRLETHIISVIINVNQEVNEDWPLVIEDNYYRQHHVVLKPGEMVFYEGARLKHGRPIALQGKSFANIFCHFKPAGYIPQTL